MSGRDIAQLCGGTSTRNSHQPLAGSNALPRLIISGQGGRVRAKRWPCSCPRSTDDWLMGVGHLLSRQQRVRRLRRLALNGVTTPWLAPRVTPVVARKPNAAVVSTYFAVTSL